MSVRSDVITDPDTDLLLQARRIDRFVIEFLEHRLSFATLRIQHHKLICDDMPANSADLLCARRKACRDMRQQHIAGLSAVLLMDQRKVVDIDERKNVISVLVCADHLLCLLEKSLLF